MAASSREIMSALIMSRGIRSKEPLLSYEVCGYFYLKSGGSVAVVTTLYRIQNGGLATAVRIQNRL